MADILREWFDSLYVVTLKDMGDGTHAPVLYIGGAAAAALGLTDAQLRATAVPVSGPLTDAEIRATALPVSGPLTDAQLRAVAVPVSGTVAATGPLTDVQLRAVAVPVSGPLTDVQLRAVAVPVSGPLTDTELRATPVPASIDQTTPGTTNKVVADVPTATPTTYNVTCTVADTEYSQALPANCRKFEFQCRTENIVRYAFATGKVATPTAPYHTLKAGDYYYSPDLNQAAAPSTLYVASPTAGVVAEILCWV